ncbi:hypothetical protein GQ55_9G629400 [Panicum hallii var. hallii]|uniref:Uncharacterized protein n=1 Tax=Panicum hallii var. hallii TaxID=1504633 RepID=A0A2T7CI65_9POAL|nr:hypothetical protein GQ55_9G629400 [Panicum hallii var. hallii]PUZ43031.1 hypothetical protein GQ55_9G629400 [Panicum hallii var. hallii]
MMSGGWAAARGSPCCSQLFPVLSAAAVPVAASPKLSGLSSLLVLALVTAGPGIPIALKLEPYGTSRHFRPLLHCDQALSRNDDDSAFRTTCCRSSPRSPPPHPLLHGIRRHALPSAAAAAPTGFTATRYGGRDSAFAGGHPASASVLGAAPLSSPPATALHGGRWVGSCACAGRRPPSPADRREEGT